MEARPVTEQYQAPQAAGKTSEQMTPGVVKHYFAVRGEIRNRGNGVLHLDGIELASEMTTTEITYRQSVTTFGHSASGRFEATKTAVEAKKIEPGGALPFEVRLDSRIPESVVVEIKIVPQGGSPRRLGSYRIAAARARTQR